MALINTIRKHSGLTAGLIAGALVLFLLGGDIFRLRAALLGKHSTQVGEIAGQKIMLQDYQTKIERLRRALSMEAGVPDTFVRDQAWQHLITQVTLQQVYKAVGITISDDELVDMVQGNHIHPELKAYFRNPETKEFDKQLLINYLQNLAQMSAAQQAQWSYFEHELAEARKWEKLIRLLQESAFVSSLEIQKQREDAQNTLHIKALYIPYYTCPDDEVSVTDNMLTYYLYEHKDRYQVKENKSIKYVVFPTKPSEEDQQAFQQALNALKKSFAQARDARVFAKLNTDGQPAASYLQLTTKQLPHTLAHKKAQLKKDLVIGPVQEDTMHKLYRIVALPDQEDQPYEIAVIEKQLAPGDQTRNQVFRKAQQCASSIRDVDQMTAYAADADMPLYEAKVFQEDTQVGILPQARELVRWLYNKAKPGQVSTPFEMGNDYVVAVMTEHVQKGTAPLDQVRDEIMLPVSNEQKAKAIMARLQQIPGTDLAERANQYGQDARIIEVTNLSFNDDTLEDAGMARKAIGAAFALTPGAQATIADENGVLVVELVGKNPAETANIYQQDQIQLERKKQLDYLTQSIEHLAKVKDHRYRFY